MPLYEYECEPCGRVFEIQHRMAETPSLACEACGTTLVRRVSAARLNTVNASSPTAAKHRNLSASTEAKKEAELQKDYDNKWLPPGVVHKH